MDASTVKATILGARFVPSMMNPSAALFMEGEGTGRGMFMVVGPMEAFAINDTLLGRTRPRPFTHDTAAEALRRFDIALNSVVVDYMDGDVFHAKMYLSDKNGSEEVVDSRPSDAIALALRMHADVYIDSELFDKVAKPMPSIKDMMMKLMEDS